MFKNKRETKGETPYKKRETNPDAKTNRNLFEWLKGFYIFDEGDWFRRLEYFVEVRFSSRDGFGIIYWDQSTDEFKNQVNVWFSDLCSQEKVKRKDGQPIVKKNVVVEHKQDKFSYFSP